MLKLKDLITVNERISVSDERYFGKKGIIIMIDVNGKKVSAIFKDKKNANKFNRNKPADIKKLLQLAKKTKYPKAIDESVNEAGMGILTSDQADVLQGIVLRNKNKNLKAILKIVLKDSMFRGVDKKELLGYIDGARQFVKYMKSHPMG